MRLAVPDVAPGTVMRTGLVNRLRASRRPLVTIAAPAGYGKTTVLAQWAARDERAFAWVSLDAADDDSGVMLRAVTGALQRAGVIADGTAPTSVTRLTAAVHRVSAPLVLVLDDVHHIRSRGSAGLIDSLVSNMPAGSTLALAGRALPELHLARHRVAGSLTELRTDDLVLGRREARILLRSTGLQLREEEVAELADHTEGWAAGLQLAGLVLQTRPGEQRSLEDFGGDDRFVAEYFRFEHLAQFGRADIRFLTRTAVLDTMCGPLCDAVLGRRGGSIAKLESLEQSSSFVVPLDRQGVRYRYHHLFREMLRAELGRREPELVPELNRRAAAWCEANGQLEAARRYAAVAGDVDALARLVSTNALPAYADGRVADLDTWLDGFGDPALLERYPDVAVVGSWIHALRGRADHAALWLEAAEHAAARPAARRNGGSLAPRTALLRAALCRNGVEQMLREAETSSEKLPWASRWRPTAVCLCGVAHLLHGDEQRADELLAEAIELATAVGAADIRRLALAERSLLATAMGDHTRARDLAHAALPPGGDATHGTDATTALELAALARVELRAANWPAARAALNEAEPLLAMLTHALPWNSVQAVLALARVHMALLDTSAAARLLSTADAIIERRPGLGSLVADAEVVRTELENLREQNGRRESTLTAAELRLLPHLCTRLSFREIGERLHVSRNTVKTQAIAVYRKLGVSSRNDAVDRATELGLVDGSPGG